MQMFSKGKMNFLKLPENVSIATPLEIFFGCLQLRKISLILMLVNGFGQILIAVSSFRLYYTLVKRPDFNATKLISVFLKTSVDSSPRCFIGFEGAQ